MEHIHVVIHHGGKFVNEGYLKYEGEIKTLCFDPDLWSYFVVVSVVKSLGYDGFKELWYSVGCGPVLDDRLQALTDDVEGIEEGGKGEELDEGVPAEGERIEVVVGQAEEVVGEDVVGEGIDVLVQETIEAEEIVGEAKEVHGEENENDVQRTEAAEVELQTPSIEVDREEADGIEFDMAELYGIEVQANTSEVDRAEAGEVEVEAEKDGEMDDVEVGDWSSTKESDGEMDNEDGLVDIDVIGQYDVSESCSDLEVEVEPFLPGSDSDMDEHDIDDSNWFNDDWQSQELISPHNSDEDCEHEGYGNFATFTQPKNMVDFNWEVGTYFMNKEDILDAIKSYAMENGKNLKLVKNDKKRIRVRCLGSKGECPWVAYFGFMGAVNSWQLRNVVDRHTCSREHKVRLFNAKWLSRKLEKTVRENPNVKGVDIRDKISRKWNIAISKNMAYRAKTYASDEVAGSFTEQYTRIFDYANEL
ncbi:hypothetical protein V8G54_008409 [Vigna mungo]|uniref:Transposase MuDR plant domain-containing protein n=1 Tax=Vigna mungo TaxID=3915 RepID=A0AAQ3P5K6_VIGMU